VFESAIVLASLRDRATPEVEGIYARADALEARARHLKLLALSVLDDRRAHEGSGCTDTEGWVAAESRCSRTNAHAQVRAARQLAALPHVADAAAEGRLSWDQLDSVVQLADADSDKRWATEAPDWSPNALARLVRKRKLVTRDEALHRIGDKSMRMWADTAAGLLRFSGALPDTDGAIFVRAVELEAEKLGRPHDGSWEPYESRCAEALVAMATQRLSEDTDPERALIHILTPVESLMEDSTAPGSELVDLELSLSIDTVRRLACEATTQALFATEEGCPLQLGVKTRTVPRWLRRLLKNRDRHCRFPGCDRTRALHAHHIVHWADGGPTELSNLILLCPYHHRYLHEHGWSVSGEPSTQAGLEFRTSSGRVFTNRSSRTHRRVTPSRGPEHLEMSLGSLPAP
jgi:hypothetical protein